MWNLLSELLVFQHLFILKQNSNSKKIHVNGLNFLVKKKLRYIELIQKNK